MLTSLVAPSLSFTRLRRTLASCLMVLLVSHGLEPCTCAQIASIRPWNISDQRPSNFLVNTISFSYYILRPIVRTYSHQIRDGFWSHSSSRIPSRRWPCVIAYRSNEELLSVEARFLNPVSKLWFSRARCCFLGSPCQIEQVGIFFWLGLLTFAAMAIRRLIPDPLHLPWLLRHMVTAGGVRP